MTTSAIWRGAVLGILMAVAFVLAGVGFAMAEGVPDQTVVNSVSAPAVTPIQGKGEISRDILQKNSASNETLAKIVPNGDYTLGSGDKIRVIVFGEDDLGGEFTVDDTGLVQLPLLGQIQATGLTVHLFEDGIAAKLLKLGYLTNPHVSVQVENYRPFYILGEVNKPGEYPFVTGMNLLNAIALAGGYTYRADESVIYIRRNGASQEEKYPANETTKINPGDILRVTERFF